jgi:hypothetical protein
MEDKKLVAMLTQIHEVLARMSASLDTIAQSTRVDQVALFDASKAGSEGHGIHRVILTVGTQNYEFATHHSSRKITREEAEAIKAWNRDKPAAKAAVSPPVPPDRS